jgi:uncharacterized protein (TIGR02145 family)
MKKLIIHLFFALIPILTFSQTYEIANKYWNKAHEFVNQNRYLEAAQMFAKSAEAEKACLNPRLFDLGNELNAAGYFYDEVGQYDRAMQCYEEALEIFKKQGEEGSIAAVLSNIGGVYKAWSQYDKAIQYFEQALEIQKRLGQESGVAIDLNNIGVVYQAWGQYDKAIQYFEEALEIFKKQGEEGSIATLLNNIGAVYNVWGQHDKAIQYYKQSLEFKKETEIEADIVKDVDDNIYKTVVIGTQTWMAENLKTIRYNDGTAIPLITDSTVWSNLTTPGYCWYGNDEATYKDVYGILYNWYTVETGNLCPSGWHVPTDDEWTTLIINYLGEHEAGGKLKETGTTLWKSPNIGATNETGFTALPSGHRIDGGAFSSIGVFGFWWSSSESSMEHAWYRWIICSYNGVSRFDVSKKSGLSVRCVRD